MVGRRGPAQAAFTNPEVIELGELEEAEVVVEPEEVELDPVSQAWIESEGADKTARVNVKTVQGYVGRTPGGRPKTISLRFLLSPVEILGKDRVEGIVLGRNELVEEDGSLRAHDTGEREELDCELIFRSVGYRGAPLAGVPFDSDSGTIPNRAGRVTEGADGPQRVGHYTAGWIKRGPSGVIGTNKKCATETVEMLIEDVAAGNLLSPSDPSPGSIEGLLAEREVHPVSFSGWERIDRAEVGRGEPHGRPRVKFASREELLAAANGEGSGD